MTFIKIMTLIKVYKSWGTSNLDTASDSLKGTALHDQSSFSLIYGILLIKLTQGNFLSTISNH